MSDITSDFFSHSRHAHTYQPVKRSHNNCISHVFASVKQINILCTYEPSSNFERTNFFR